MLTEAINKRKNQVQEAKISSGTSSPYYRGGYSSYYKPSRNVTLINNNSSTSSALKAGASNNSQTNKDLYIKKGNKLIRLEGKRKNNK